MGGGEFLTPPTPCSSLLSADPPPTRTEQVLLKSGEMKVHLGDEDESLQSTATGARLAETYTALQNLANGMTLGVNAGRVYKTLVRKSKPSPARR
jgi:hypothetical protein